MVLGSNLGMGFLCTNDLQLMYNGDFTLDLGFLYKQCDWWFENYKQNEIECKNNSLKSRATGLEVLGQLEGPRVLFLTLGRMTYSHFSNRIFVWL